LCSGLAYHDHYWIDTDRHPYLIRVDGKLAVFVLIRLETLKDGRRRTNMSEFFIMRKYRRQGIGRAVASHMFDLYPGNCEVAQLLCNHAAIAFWRKVIGDYTGGQFEEATWEDRFVAQTFDSPGSLAGENSER
jgi:predicted acetyltransferase